MEEFKFESLTALYERLLPAFNTKCNELKNEGINVSEISLWNYLKDNKWQNAKNLSMSSLVNDILSLKKEDLIKNENKDSEINEY